MLPQRFLLAAVERPPWARGTPPTFQWSMLVWFFGSLIAIRLTTIVAGQIWQRVQPLHRYYGYKRLNYGLAAPLLAWAISLGAAWLLRSQVLRLSSDGRSLLAVAKTAAKLIGLGALWLRLSPRVPENWPLAEYLETARRGAGWLPITCGGLMGLVLIVQLIRSSEPL